MLRYPLGCASGCYATRSAAPLDARLPTRLRLGMLGYPLGCASGCSATHSAAPRDATLPTRLRLGMLHECAQRRIIPRSPGDGKPRLSSSPARFGVHVAGPCALSRTLGCLWKGFTRTRPWEPDDQGPLPRTPYLLQDVPLHEAAQPRVPMLRHHPVVGDHSHVRRRLTDRDSVLPPDTGTTRRPEKRRVAPAGPVGPAPRRERRGTAHSPSGKAAM